MINKSESEKNNRYCTKFNYRQVNDITEAIANSVITSSESLDIKAIVVPTSGGHSPSVISNLRPKTIILAPCPSDKVARSLALNYGVYPIVVPNVRDDDMDNAVSHAKREAISFLGLKEKDKIIITGGIHENKAIKQTNFMKIEEI